MAKRTVEEIEAVALAVRAKNQSVKRGHPKYTSNLTSAEERALTEGVIFLVHEVRRMRQETDRLENAVQGIAGSHARLHASRDELTAEIERLKAGLRTLHEQVDITDPSCPVGVALTVAGLERKP